MEKDPSLLLSRIRNGDESAFDILAEDYRALIEGAVKRFSVSFGGEYGIDPVYESDDLRQYAALALYKAAKTYDPDVGKNVSFGLYAKICVNNAMISVLRKFKSEQKRKLRAREKTEKPVLDPLMQLISVEDESNLITRISSTLSGLEKEVFDLYIVGKSAGEIAERLNREEKSVSNALYRMKVKIKGLLKN